MRISDWSSDVCSSDLPAFGQFAEHRIEPEEEGRAQHESRDDILAGCREQPRQPHLVRMLVGIMVEPRGIGGEQRPHRSEEHTSELQSLMRISYAVFCLKKKTHKNTTYGTTNQVIHHT